MTARRPAWLLAALLACSVGGSARAVEPDEVLPNQALEARARAISSELRCLVCQNQSIDDSEAPIAKDLRLLIRDRLKAGATDREARDYLVRRYGEFVLLRPVVALHTALLWFGPAFVLMAGAAGIVLARRRPRAQASRHLTQAEAARIRALETAEDL